LRVDEKVALIRAIENGEKRSDVGKRFGFSQSTIATIWKCKAKLLRAETEGGRSRKRIRKPKFENLDQAVFAWYCQQRSNNVPISGPVLKTEADKFARQFGITDFKASEGWLGKFKRRHDIIYGPTSGTARNVYSNVANGRPKDDGEEDERQRQRREEFALLIESNIRRILGTNNLLEKYLSFREDDPKFSQNAEQIRRKLQRKLLTE